MIRWLLFAALAFLVIAALQGMMANRREKKSVEGKDIPTNLPPLPNATELEKSRHELEALEQRLNIPHTGREEKGA
jgi:hypothetical protein